MTNKEKNSKIGIILGWIFGIIFSIFGLIGLFDNFITGILFLILSFLILPSAAKRLDKQFQIKLGGKIKTIVIIILIALIGILGENKNLPQQKESTIENIKIGEQKKDLALIQNDEINKIHIKIEQQDIIDGKQKILIWIENNSNYIFKGDLSYSAKENNNNLGNDTIFIEKLLPSQKIYSIIRIKPAITNINNTYQRYNIEFNEDQTKNQDNKLTEYKLIKHKEEPSGLFVAKLEYFLATDKDFNKMYNFIKNREINKGTLYYAVFITDEKYAIFTKYPITAEAYSENESLSKHIIATYRYNTENKNKQFSYYDKNSFESVAKTRND